jgi:hypothetical protein
LGSAYPPFASLSKSDPVYGFYFFLGIGARLTITCSVRIHGDIVGRCDFGANLLEMDDSSDTHSVHELNVKVATSVVPQIVELARRSDYLGIQIAGDKLAVDVADTEYPSETLSALLRFAARIALHEFEVTNGQRDREGNYVRSNPFAR